MSSPGEQRHNLRVAELAYTAFNAGNLDALLKLVHEEIEVSVPEPEANAGTHRGHDECREWMDSLADCKVEVLEVVPVGSSRMVVVAKEGAQVLEFRDGKVVMLHVQPSREEALAAAEKREAGEADE
jgi:ketosteroid isomerase-like protein